MSVATIATPPEQRVVLHDVSWDLYDRLTEEHSNTSVPRFTYDRGELEIMGPGFPHEQIADLVRYLVLAICEARGIDMTGAGSTTYKSKRWQRGFEPDACFYVGPSAVVARTIERMDPERDPSRDGSSAARDVGLRCDVLFEVDITSSSIHKLPLYAQFGVPEVWRHDGDTAEILLLRGDEYVPGSSAAFPGLDAATLTRLMDDGTRMPSPEWLREVRSWAAG